MPEPQSWDRVLAAPAYQALPREEKLAAKRQYFQQVMAPQIGTDKGALNDAYGRFMDYRPIELGDRETLRRSGEAGLREGWAGLLRTAGALHEYAGEYPSAEMGVGLDEMRPVYGLGDPQFKEADRQTDLAQRAAFQPGEHGPWYDRLLGGTTGIVAAPFAAQQAAATQLLQGASEGRAIAAAAAETPASALQMAAPAVGGRLGGGLMGPGLRGLAAKAAGGGLLGAAAEPVATGLRNLGLPEAQRQPVQVTPAGIGASAVFGLLARGARLGEAPTPAPEQLPGLGGIEVHEGEPEHIELRGLWPEEGEEELPPGTGLEVYEGEPERVEARGLEPPEVVAPIRNLEVVTYGESVSREVPGDELTGDHIPSFAAIKRHVQANMGRRLTPEQITALRNNTNAVVMNTAFHASGRTHFEKNTPAQIVEDAQDLNAAALRDQSIYLKNAERHGYNEAELQKSFALLNQRNRSLFSDLATKRGILQFFKSLGVEVNP